MSRLCQVKASAGSGKTYELTRCFLLRLMECGHKAGVAASPACALASESLQCGWGDILAVTFTNAAAAEMRERVIRRLKSAALGMRADDLPLDEEEARRWVDVIMRDLSALNIRTIDSLLHLIVRAAALELNLHPEFQPVFATEEALTPYLDLFLERAWREDAAMRDLLREACRALVTHGGSKGFLAGEKLIHQLKDLLDDVLRGRFDHVTPQAVLKEKLQEMDMAAVHAAREFLTAAQDAGLQWKKPALDAVRQLAQGQTDKCSSAFASKENPEELFRKGTVVPPEAERAFAAYTASARQRAREGELIVQALRLAPFVRLAQTLVNAFLQNQEQEGALPGLLVPGLAREVLEGERGVPEALCRLGTRLTHFLVDEFQDTSREQWQALRPLVEEALSRGGSLTWVGDVKQSIYGWRGGEPELFDAVFEDQGLVRLAPDGERRSLPRNWRSRRDVVEHNNRIFTPLAQALTAQRVLAALLPADTPPAVLTAATQRLNRAFAATAQQCPPQARDGGLVRAEEIQGTSQDDLRELVLERLCELLRDEIGPRRAWSDVLVLVRGNETARVTAEGLVREGIPVITENSLLLAEHPLIVQIVALLAFLDNPEDDIAFWTLLTGSIVLEHPQAAELDWEALHAWCADAGRGPLYLRFRQRWPRIWQELLAPFHGQSGLMTPYDTVLEWFAHLDVEQRFPEACTFLRRFMEVLQSAEEKGLATVSTFLEHWRDKSGEEKVPMPENMNAVRVMTIHKSKGLEAPVVILPWTGFSVRPSGRPVLLERNGLRMVVPNRKALGEVYYADLARQACENLDLLYVAFTRARDELHIFRTGTSVQKNRSGSLCAALDILWQEAGLSLPYRLGAPPEELPDVTADERAGPEALPAPCSRAAATEQDWRPMQWLPRLKIFRNPLGGFAFKAEDRGVLLHFCLEHLRITGHAKEDARAALLFGLRHFPLPVPDDAALRQSLTEALAWFAAQPEAARWLERGWPEQSLMDGQGHVLRMDLLVRETWGSLVIDYKSGQPQAQHILQVRRYLDCLEQCGDYRGTARALLVYLDQRRFQLVEADKVSGLCETCDALLPAAGDKI